MSADYRQKLLHWWCSIITILACAALGTLLFWFLNVPEYAYEATFTPGMMVIFLAGPILVYPAIFPFVLFWHFFDFIQKPSPIGHHARLISSYRSFFFPLITLAIILIAVTNRTFTTDSCTANPQVYHSECIIQEPLWFELVFSGAALILLSLCICKGLISILSLRSK